MKARLVFQLWRWRASVSVTALVLLIGGLIGSGVLVGYAQSQTCRDVNNLTICGDTFDEFEATFNGGGFRLRGNVKIGPKGGAAVVKVTNTGSIFDGTVLNENITTASYFHLNQADPNTGTTDFLIGEVAFINDPTGLPLFSTSAFDHPPVGGEVTAGRLFVDTTNRRIFLPAEGQVPIFTQRGVARNQAYSLGFISQAGALSFYKDGGSVNELRLVDAEFDITNKLFKATLPVDLKLNESAENPDLRLTMRFQWTENRQFSGSVDGFKGHLAGLLMDVSGVKFTPASAPGVTPATPASFEAALVKVLKTDNPDVPTLDPSDPTLIFSFTKLQYKAGNFAIGGVEVPVNNWEFGNAFKMTNQTLGIISENNIQALQIKSTLNFFGDDGDSKRKVPIILKVGRTESSPGVFKPVFAAGLQNVSPKIGNFTFNLQGAVFSGNAVENFWGIKATTAALQWPAHLGGKTAAGINNFRLGIKLDANKNKKFDVGLGGGSFSLPPFENQVFRGTLGATLGVVSDTMVITGTGNFTFKLPGNSNSAGIQTTAILRYGKGVVAPTPPVPPTGGTLCRRPDGAFLNCPGGLLAAEANADALKEFELKLSGFTVKIAGFGMTVTNPKSTDDGGFAADNVAATLPAGLVFDNIGSGADTNGITIQGLVVPGTGDIQIAGGGFELAPIKFGGYQFVGLKGNFVKLPEGGFEFKAGGKLPLPGIEPGANGGGIGAEVRIRIKPDNSVNGFGVTVTFTAGGAIPKIKMPGTGMSLVKMTGGFDIVANTSTIFVTVTAASDVAIPLGSLGSLPIATAEGGVIVQVTPNFKLSANAKLSILVFQVATASVNIGNGFGFNGGAGMDVSFVVNTLFIDGSAHLKVGEVTLSNGSKKVRVQGDATVSVVVPAKIFAGLPRDPKTLASVSVGFGQYKDTKNGNRQSAGLLAMGSLSLVGTIGGFLDMGTQPIDLIFFTDPDRFQAVPGALLRQWAREGRAGYGSRILSADEVVALGLADEVAAANASQPFIEDSIVHNLAAPTRLLMGMEYTGTLPANSAIRLKLPNGTILTKATAISASQSYTEEKDSQGGVLMFVLQNAVAGNYDLLLDNPPADYSANILELDQMPEANITSDTCGGGNTAGVTVVCSATDAVDASQVAALETNQVSVNWSASDIDTPNATVDVGFVQVISGVVDNTTFSVLEENKPLGNGSFVWNLNEVPSGEYRVMIEVSNDSGPAVRAYGSKLIKVTDKRAPAVPASFTIAALANELSVRWSQNSERDLAGYEIGLGVVANQADDVNNFFYQRNMGPKETITGTNNLVDAKLWGIPDDTEVFFGIRAYDYSGNYSAWSPLLRARPWALSPNTWTPLPNGNGSGFVEVAFATPMKFDSLDGALTIKDGTSNTVVPGQSYFLTNEAGNVIGVGFTPERAIKGAASATLKGGTNGVQAVDGRTMGGDYSWGFTLQPAQIYLPLLSR